jgi:hypothetical protein
MFGVSMACDSNTEAAVAALVYLKRLYEITSEKNDGSIIQATGNNNDAQMAIAKGRLSGISSGALVSGQPDILESLASAVPALISEDRTKMLQLIQDLAASPVTVDKPFASEKDRKIAKVAAGL